MCSPCLSTKVVKKFQLGLINPIRARNASQRLARYLSGTGGSANICQYRIEAIVYDE